MCEAKNAVLVSLLTPDRQSELEVLVGRMVGRRSPTTPLRRTAWRGVCLPPPPSPPPRSGTGPPAAITCSTSASLSDLYLIINLMALETICIEKSIHVFQFKLSCIIQPVSKWCFLNGLNDHNQV